MIDVIIPSHWKDIDTLDLCIEGIRNRVKDVRRIIVVSKDKMTDNAEHFPESAFPFSLEDVGDIVGIHRKTCKYFGGTLQITAPCVIPDLTKNILTCDADHIFLRETEFVNDKGIALYNVSYDIPKTISSHPYLEHCEKLIPGLTKQTEYSGVCHHILFQKDILQEIFDKVQQRYKMPFWRANLNVTLQPYKSLTHPSQTKNGKPVHADCPLLITTYEFYFNYVMKFYRDRCRIRKQNSILSYKGRLGYSGENVENIGSRTNLNGNQQILDPNLEKTFNFESPRDAIENTIYEIEKLGKWDAVTFQNHQRIGAAEDRRRHEKEINEIHTNYKL